MQKFILSRLYRGVASRVKSPASKPMPPFTYVALGDSTVEGIGASHPERNYVSIIYSHLKLRHKKAIHYNFGKSEARVQDVIATQLDKAISANPDLVTLSVGPNDIANLTKLSVFRQRLSQLIEVLQAQTHAMIVVTNVPNFSLLRAVPLPLKPIATLQIRRFNKCILEVVESHHAIHIDTYEQSTVFAKHLPEAVSGDNFHPSDIGYALWANTIVTTIQHRITSLGLVTPESTGQQVQV